MESTSQQAYHPSFRAIRDFIVSPLLIYPLVPAIVIGLLNWLYWRRQGYTSLTQLGLNIVVFYALFYATFKFFFF